jgi:hypothetical protein
MVNFKALLGKRGEKERERALTQQKPFLSPPLSL